MKIKFQQHHKKQGMALVVVMIVLLVFTVLYSGFAYVSTRNIKSTTQAQNFNEAYYAAEAGINIMVELIQQEAQVVYDMKASNDEFVNVLNARVMENISSDSVSFNSLSNAYDVSVGDITASVSVEELAIDDEVTSEYIRVRYGITSIGKKYDQTRELYTTLGVQYYLPKEDTSNSFMMDVAVLAFGEIKASGSFKILDAPTVTLSDKVPAIQWNSWPGINNQPVFQLPNLGSCAEIKKRINVADSSYDVCAKTTQYVADTFVPNIVMPDIPDNIDKLTTSQKKSYYLPALKHNGSMVVSTSGNFSNPSWLGSNFTYTFPADRDIFYVPTFKITNNNDTSMVLLDVGNRDVSVVTDSFQLVGQSAYKVIGTGKLKIYALNDIQISGNETNGNSEDTTKTLLFSYKDNLTINLGGSKKIYFSIMAKNMNFNVGAGATFRGNIVTGGSSVSISGGTSSEAQLIYAPYGDVNFSGSGDLRGAVVANNFTGSGGASIIYNAAAFTDLPFEITSPVITDPDEPTPSEGHIFIINQDIVVER